MKNALFAGIVFVGGCSLLVPLDATSGGGDDPAADANAEGTTSSSGDATASSSSGGSSGTPSDSATSDAAPLVCPTTAILCDDFERDDLGSANGWKVTGLAISKQRSHSPTRSVAIYDATSDYRAMERTFDLPPIHLRVTFRLHSGVAPAGFVELFKMPFGPAYQWDTATLGLDSNGLQVAMQRYDGQTGPAVFNGVQGAPAAAVYQDGFRLVVWEIDFRADEKKVFVSVDGSAPVSFTLVGHSPSVGPAVLAIGTLYRNSDAPILDTYVDDVVVEPL